MTSHMSPEHERDWPESGDLGVTELTLALPGTSNRRQKSGIKRGFLTTVDLNLGDEQDVNKYTSSITKPSPKGQLVGWPPVRTTRKIGTTTVRRKYVKVAVDGAAYLRKVDLETYNCYQQLLTALENMFQGLIICKTVTELESTKGVQEFIATYEDKDSDLMLLGDVPWMMFVESCKRLRLIKSTDAINLVAR